MSESKSINFDTSFDLCRPFKDDELFEPYAFKKGELFCIIPPDFLFEEYEDRIDLSDKKWYVKCIPNKTSFGELMIVTLGKLYEKENKWIIKNMINNGGHTFFNGFFKCKDGIWYYQCDS